MPPARRPLRQLPLERFSSGFTLESNALSPRRGKRTDGPVFPTPTARIPQPKGIFPPSKSLKNTLRSLDSPSKPLDACERSKRSNRPNPPSRSSSEEALHQCQQRPSLPGDSGSVIAPVSPADKPVLFAAPTSIPPKPTYIPRELPPQPDPSSKHYPGFVVYQDPHTVVFSVVEAASLTFPTEKENVPQRRALLRFDNPTAFSSGTSSATSHKHPSSSTPTSMKKMVEVVPKLKSTPARSTPIHSSAWESSLLVPSAAISYDRKEARKRMQDEVNEVASESEGEDDAV